MKLRNKKTGEVEKCEAVTIQTDVRIFDYSSIADLNKEWEDYKPKEPLIKDEKVRKAVRAWAETNLIKEISYSARLYGSSCLLTDIGGDQWSIEFVGWIPTLKDGEDYTIAELCGEEEE